MVFGDNSESRVLAERGGAWDAEEVAVEVDGERERRYEVEERGESEGRDGATVVIGHHAFDRTVVSDPSVAQLHGFDYELYARGFVGL